MNGIQIECIRRMFQRICKKLRETGTLTIRKSKRRKRVCQTTCEDNEINSEC